MSDKSRPGVSLRRAATVISSGSCTFGRKQRNTFLGLGSVKG